MLCSGSDLCGTDPDGLCACRAELLRAGSDLLRPSCPELLCSGCADLWCSWCHGSGSGTSPGAGCPGSASGRAGSEAEGLVRH
jgi:hypothetical protein